MGICPWGICPDTGWGSVWMGCGWDGGWMERWVDRVVGGWIGGWMDVDRTFVLSKTICYAGFIFWGTGVEVSIPKF